MNEIDDDDLLDRHRWVRITCGYCCDGAWDVEGRSCGVEDLPISRALVERIRHWQAHYENAGASSRSASLPPRSI